MGNARFGDPCTPRQLEILRLSAEGYSNTALGKALFLSISTIEVQMREISDKLGSKGKTNSVAIALRRGLIS